MKFFLKALFKILSILTVGIFIFIGLMAFAVLYDPVRKETKVFYEYVTSHYKVGDHIRLSDLFGKNWDSICILPSNDPQDSAIDFSNDFWIDELNLSKVSLRYLRNQIPQISDKYWSIILFKKPNIVLSLPVNNKLFLGIPSVIDYKDSYSPFCSIYDKSFLLYDLEIPSPYNSEGRKTLSLEVLLE
jgi:hypothetical protein